MSEIGVRSLGFSLFFTSTDQKCIQRTTFSSQVQVLKTSDKVPLDNKVISPQAYDYSITVPCTLLDALKHSEGGLVIQLKRQNLPLASIVSLQSEAIPADVAT